MRLCGSEDSLPIHRPKPIKEARWSHRLKTEAGEQGLREVFGVPGHDHIRLVVNRQRKHMSVILIGQLHLLFRTVEVAPTRLGEGLPHLGFQVIELRLCQLGLAT